MAHLVRVRTDIGWVNIGLVQASEFRGIDQNTFLAINGDDGATYTPSGPIIIGGAGMTAACLWTMGNGNLAQTLAASGKRLTLGDSDYFVFFGGHTGATRHTLADGADMFFTQGAFSFAFDGIKFACESLLTTGARGLLPLKVVDGSTFTSVTLSFIVTVTHPNVPQYLPKYRVYALDETGAITILVTTVDPDGYTTFPTPASGAAWFNAGNPQTIALTIDAGVVVDATTKTYWLEITDERGTNALAGNAYTGADCLFSAITDTRFQ